MCVWKTMRWKQRLMEVGWKPGQSGMGDGVWKGQRGRHKHQGKSRRSATFIECSVDLTSPHPSSLIHSIHCDNYLLEHKQCAYSDCLYHCCSTTQCVMFARLGSHCYSLFAGTKRLRHMRTPLTIDFARAGIGATQRTDCLDVGAMYLNHAL
jgi:hypothetical protein